MSHEGKLIENLRQTPDFVPEFCKDQFRRYKLRNTCGIVGYPKEFIGV